MKQLTFALIGLVVLGSCSKVKNCECKTTWIEYTEFGPANREKITANPVKGNKKDAKTQCGIIATNQPQTDGYYTECSVKK